MAAAHDERFMRLALLHARRGRPSPNPHVGAVVVRDGQVLATGFHARAGEAHAEVRALAQLAERGGDARGATLYVTLEPCNHHGRTGPCSEAVLEAGIARVVIGSLDPVPGHGGGARRLRAAGVEVLTGVCEDEARRVIADFATHAREGRPYVMLKAAVTLDGRMAAAGGDSRWITGKPARTEAHRMRDRADAVMVGVGTVLCDDPALTVRHVKGRDPVRVVLDSSLQTPPEAAVIGGDERCWVFHGPQASAQRRESLRVRGAVLFEVPLAGAHVDLECVLAALAGEGIVRLLVEGGPRVHGALLDRGLVDWASVFVAPRILGDPQGLPLAAGARRHSMAEACTLQAPSVRRLGDDVLFEGPLEHRTVFGALARP